MKDGVLKGKVISSRTSAQMTTDFRLFIMDLISYATSKGYKKWPGVLEEMEFLKDKVWKTTQQDKKLYAQIMITEVKGTDAKVIKKQEWIVTDCKKELKLEENYNDKLQQKLPEKALF